MSMGKKSIISEDTLDKQSTTRICIIIAYVSSSILTLIDVFYQKGISANSITLCGMMLGSGVLQYGTNTYKNVKGRSSAQ